MDNFILSLDQGTTSSKAIIFDRFGKSISIAQKEFKQIYPHPGWVEHDAKEIWSSQAAVITESLIKANINDKNIAAIGVTNQRETTLLWDKNTGEPIYNAIVWQDHRTSDYCDILKKQHWINKIREKTGLIIDSYFSATKIKWLLDHIPGAREKAQSDTLAFGTIDSWLIWNLTNKQVHVTDITNASRTMLFNINTLSWDEELLELFNIPKSILPEVKSSSEFYGVTNISILPHRVPITGIAGDQHAALFGQMCTEVGMVKNTYGTGCFMLMNIGNKPILSKNNLLTTIAWKIKDEIQYALEGSVFIGGAVIQWLKDGLHILSKSSESEKFANSVPDTQGVYLVPAFSGLGAPYWDQYARGTIVGITCRTTAAHLTRAALESIAFQSMDVMQAMEIDSGISIEELRVDGGGSNNKLLLQFQADILDIKVIIPKYLETTALGAAYLAGLAIGYWSSIEEIKSQWGIGHIFNPKKMPNRVQRLRAWSTAVKATQSWSYYTKKII